MNTMKNFAAQLLTKKQMNEVKGGAAVTCMWKVNGELRTSLGVSFDLNEAMNQAAAGVPNGVNASCHILS